MTYYTKEQEFMATLGKTINTLRKSKGFTQEEFASMLGISPQAVSKWENDMTCPDIMLLPKIAKIFNVTVDSLLSGEAEPETEADTQMVLPAESEKTQERVDSETKTEAKGLRVKKLHIAITTEGKTKNILVPIGIVGFGLNLGKIFGGLTGSQAEEINKSVRKGIQGEILSVDGDNGEHVTISLE